MNEQSSLELCKLAVRVLPGIAVEKGHVQAVGHQSAYACSVDGLSFIYLPGVEDSPTQSHPRRELDVWADDGGRPGKVLAIRWDPLQVDVYRSGHWLDTLRALQASRRHPAS